MIISTGAGYFVRSFVFLLWEQQGFVPVNSYPMKLLLDLNFGVQIKQKWKNLKACIPKLMTSFFFFFPLFLGGVGVEIIPFKIWKNKAIALGIHCKIFKQINILWKSHEVLEKIFCSFYVKSCISFPEAMVSPAYCHSFSIVNIVSVLPLLHQTLFLSDCWRQLVQHKKVCVFICCGQTLRKDESM